MNDKRIAEIRARCEQNEPPSYEGALEEAYIRKPKGAVTLVCSQGETSFIAHSRADLPWLLEHLEAETRRADAASG